MKDLTQIQKLVKEIEELNRELNFIETPPVQEAAYRLSIIEQQREAIEKLQGLIKA